MLWIVEGFEDVEDGFAVEEIVGFFQISLKKEGWYVVMGMVKKVVPNFHHSIIDGSVEEEGFLG